MTQSLAELSKGALSDLAGVFAAMPEDALVIRGLSRPSTRRCVRCRQQGEELPADVKATYQ